MQERKCTFRTDLALRDTRTLVLNTGDPEAKREEIRRYFHATFDIDEALLETLRFHETFYKRADPLRHPLIFYFGHTAVFYVNKLIIAKLIEQRIHPAYESMFAVGVDEMSWDDLDRTFVRLDEPRDIPFVIRETNRKHQHTLAQVTVWERRSDTER